MTIYLYLIFTYTAKFDIGDNIMKNTISIENAKMTLAVIAQEHDIPYNTINTAEELIDCFSIPPDIYIIDSEYRDPALELVYELEDHRYLRFSVREKSRNVINGMINGYKTEHIYGASVQDCINVYKQYKETIERQFSFYEEFF